MQLFETITRLISSKSIHVDFAEHAAVFTSKAASALCGHTDEEGTKSLVVVADAELAVVTVAANERVDFGAVKRLLGVRKVKMAANEDLFLRLGTENGGVAPFGYDESITIVVSASLFDQRQVHFNPGKNDVTATMAGSDFKTIVLEAPRHRILESSGGVSGG